jgi:DNA-binding PadR family transcriptional regulator
MSAAPNPESHLPLSVPVHQILLSLANQDRHGYAVIQDIRERTDGEVKLTASTLYGALSRMLSSGVITEVKNPKPNPEEWDSRRRYYRISTFGRAVARVEARRLSRVLEQARDRGLGPDPTPETRKGTT